MINCKPDQIELKINLKSIFKTFLCCVFMQLSVKVDYVVTIIFMPMRRVKQA